MSMLVKRAYAGDIAIQRIFARAGTALGVAIANLINILDPSLVLIGGEGLRAGDLLLDPLRATLPLHVFGSSGEAQPGDGARLLVRTTTEVEWARGAASLVLREIFRAPIYETGMPLAIDDLLAQARPRTTANLVRAASGRR